MAASEEILTRVKNTFIEVSFKRIEKKRTMTIPSNWKLLDIADNAEAKSFCNDCLMGSTRSGASTTVPSSRSRTNSGCSTPDLGSGDGSEIGDGENEFFADARQRPWWFDRVWELARDRQGCRHLQCALELMSDEDERLAILFEMQGHVQEACRCPQANYVLQKLIILVQPVHLRFILHEITSKGARAASMVARHKYGCRVIQRLLERCPHEQTMLLAEQLLVDPEALETCAHLFGNYTMQHLYEHGSTSQRQQLVALLAREVATARAGHVCTVIGKVLANGDRNDKHILAQALHRVPGLLACMAGTKSAQFAARLACQVLKSR